MLCCVVFLFASFGCHFVMDQVEIVEKRAMKGISVVFHFVEFFIRMIDPPIAQAIESKNGCS